MLEYEHKDFSLSRDTKIVQRSRRIYSHMRKDTIKTAYRIVT